MTIRVGVIGLGIVSSRIITQFDEHPEFSLVAVCDVDESRVREFTETAEPVQGFSDYRKVLQMADVDLVYVATPPAAHANIVNAALRADKHVLCEKPLANSLEEAGEMLQVAVASGKVHALHFPLQYSHEMLEFARLYQSGYLGELRRVEVIMQFPAWPRAWQQNAWVGGRSEGGYTLEVGVHFIQSIHRIFGPVGNITGQIMYPDDENACENSVLAMGTLPNNVQVLFNGLSQVGVQERVELNAYGTKGMISLKNWRNLFVGTVDDGLSPAQPLGQSPSLMDNLANAIQGSAPFLCDFQVGYDAQRVLEAIRGLA